MLRQRRYDGHSSGLLEPGFTLVEVMVALAVVAIALPALIMTLYYQLDGTEHLRDKALAQMVAANKLAELRLLSEARQSVLDGSDSGTAILAERHWSWRIESSETTIHSFYRVDILVRAGESVEQGPALYNLVAFIASPRQGSATEEALSAGN